MSPQVDLLLGIKGPLYNINSCHKGGTLLKYNWLFIEYHVILYIAGSTHKHHLPCLLWVIDISEELLRVGTYLFYKGGVLIRGGDGGVSLLKGTGGINEGGVIRNGIQHKMVILLGYNILINGLLNIPIYGLLINIPPLSF